MAQVKTGSSIEERIRLVRESFEADERGDKEAAKRAYAEDAVFHSQVRGADFKGRDEIFAEGDRQEAEFKLKAKLHDVCASDDHAVALSEMTSEVDGRQQTNRVVQVMHFNDQGLISEVWALFNPQASAQG